MTTQISGTTGLSINALPFLVGQVIFTAGVVAPAGFLKCDGSAVSRTAYQALFAAIGTTFGGGDGATTFNIPDLRGEFIRGFDDGRGIDSGRVFGSAQNDAFQGHRHKLTDLAGTEVSIGSTFSAGSGGTGKYTLAYSADSVRDEKTNGADGTPRTARETRPRNVALLACIFTGI